MAPWTVLFLCLCSLALASAASRRHQEDCTKHGDCSESTARPYCKEGTCRFVTFGATFRPPLNKKVTVPGDSNLSFKWQVFDVAGVITGNMFADWDGVILKKPDGSFVPAGPQAGKIYMLMQPCAMGGSIDALQPGYAPAPTTLAYEGNGKQYRVDFKAPIVSANSCWKFTVMWGMTEGTSVEVTVRK